MEALPGLPHHLRHQLQTTHHQHECDSQDEAYAFFLQLLEDLTTSYYKLWARIKDLGRVINLAKSR